MKINKGYGLRAILILLVIIPVFLKNKIAVADVPSNPQSFIAFLEAGFPRSGEITVIMTNFIPPPPNPKLVIPLVQTFHAVWNESNFFIEELTPQTGIAAHSSGGLLVGQNQDFLWHAVNTELDLVQRTNNLSAADSADCPIGAIVDFGKSTIRTALMGGMPFDEINWTGENFVAKIDGIPIRGRLIFTPQTQELTGTFEAAEPGGFRVQYLEWDQTNANLRPKKFNVFMQYPGEKAFRQKYAVEISDVKTPHEVADETIFTPQYHINTNYFKSYLYTSNAFYYVGSKGLQEVRLGSLDAGILSHKFFTIILLLTAVFIPSFWWYRSNKK